MTFLEDGHIYLSENGVIIPSVSEILHFIFPDKYKSIPEYILNKKADYGEVIHKSVEMYEHNLKVVQKDEAFDITTVALDLNDVQQFSLKQYLRLKEKYNIKVQMQEMMLNYKDIYAGRFDMIATVKDFYSLCDIKTTAELDKEYLSWQLSLYELAYRYMYHTPQFDKLYAIWLPRKGYGELVEIERKSYKEILDVLKKFQERENTI